ncbi:hypothetical protein UY3_15947 [Chelonia mydas]|uniref:Uncharacterized protein n=1 Tax=Chelonia mydas TaxID=8469 RepID=M7BFF6_CHEMY|nr:hypothetical protein UY3_15947 [Chelonia mydas]
MSPLWPLRGDVAWLLRTLPQFQAPPPQLPLARTWVSGKAVDTAARRTTWQHFRIGAGEDTCRCFRELLEGSSRILLRHRLDYAAGSFMEMDTSATFLPPAPHQPSHPLQTGELGAHPGAHC